MSGLTSLALREQTSYQRDEIDSLKARVRLLETQELPFVSRLRIDAKGDLFVGTADNTYDRLAIGANGLVLLANSAQTAGMQWGTVESTGIADNAVTTAKIIDDAVTNAKLANMAQATVKGRQLAGGTGDPEDLTATQLNAIVATADLFHTSRIWSGVGSDEGRGQTGTPPLTVKGNSLLIYRESADTQPPNLEFLKRRSGSGTAVQNGDMLGSIVWTGADTTTFGAIGAIIRAEVDGTPGSADMPGRILFLTSPDGTGSPAEAFRINNAGHLIMANSRRIETDEVRARDGDGLLLRDDGGNLGIFIQDATGYVGIGTNNPDNSLVKTVGTIGGSGRAAFNLDPTQGSAGGTQYGMLIVGQAASPGADNWIALGIHGGTITNKKASIWISHTDAARPGINCGFANTVTAPSLGLIVAGNTGLGNSNPSALLHVGAGADTPVVSPTLYTSAAGTTNLVVRNSSNDTEAFIQCAGASVVMGSSTNHPLRFFENNGEVARFSGGRLGVGTTSPQGLLHGHDGTGGFLFVTKTGIVGSAVTIIPDGTGDVTQIVHFDGIIRSTDNVFIGSIESFVGNNTFCLNNASNVITFDGSNQITFSVSSAGVFTVQRTNGTKTYEVVLYCVWR